jgi:hypothetical protein
MPPSFTQLRGHFIASLLAECNLDPDYELAQMVQPKLGFFGLFLKESEGSQFDHVNKIKRRVADGSIYQFPDTYCKAMLHRLDSCSRSIGEASVPNRLSIGEASISLVCPLVVILMCIYLVT